MIQNFGLKSKEFSPLPVMHQVVENVSSDDEEEPMSDVGRDESGMYEVERILAKKRVKVFSRSPLYSCLTCS